MNASFAWYSHRMRASIDRTEQPSTCRDEVLGAARNIVRAKRRNEFAVAEVVGDLVERGTKYSESTIRTHVTSRCCRNTPENHAVRCPDFERTGRGLYLKIIVRARPAGRIQRFNTEQIAARSILQPAEEPTRRWDAHT